MPDTLLLLKKQKCSRNFSADVLGSCWPERDHTVTPGCKGSWAHENLFSHVCSLRQQDRTGWDGSQVVHGQCCTFTNRPSPPWPWRLEQCPGAAITKDHELGAGCGGALKQQQWILSQSGDLKSEVHVWAGPCSLLGL